MIKKQLFEKTIGILKKSYKSGDLKNLSCTCCAVGNLVADASNCYARAEYDGHVWRDKDTGVKVNTIPWPYTVRYISQEELNTNPYVPSEFLEVAPKLGYTLEQLKCIEAAFESWNDKWAHGRSRGDRLKQGLSNVYDQLCEIHEVAPHEKKPFEQVFEI